MAAAQNFGLEEAAKLGSGDGIEAARRFIEEKNTRLVEQSASKAQSLDCAGGESPDLTVERFSKLELFRE
jgi:hypothetical protein